MAYYDLGANYFIERAGKARATRRLIGQLNHLGHQVTLNPCGGHMSGWHTTQLTTIFVSAVESSRDAGRPIDSSHRRPEYGELYPTSLGDSKPTADSHEHPARTVRNMQGYQLRGCLVVIMLRHNVIRPECVRE